MEDGAIFSSSASQTVAREFFRKYPGEAVRQIHQLPLAEIQRVLESLPRETAAVALTRLNPEIAANVLSEGSQDFFTEALATIEPSHGAALLSRIDRGKADALLAGMPKPQADELRGIMQYPRETAGALMDPRILVFRGDETVGEALRRIRSVKDKRIVNLNIVDEERILVGVASLQQVAVSEPGVRLGSLVERDPISIQALEPKNEVVALLQERKLPSIPVVDFDGRLLGVIRHDALVAAAQADAIEDVQAMFGAGREERALSSPLFAIRKRLPWLEVNLVTAFLAAAVVGMFEDTIAKITALAVFLPVVAGQSGNTGSQALAVTMRGLALREIRTRHWLPIVSKEALVGLVNGLVVAATTGVVAYIWMGSVTLGLVIAAAMVVSMAVAGMAGAAIPVMLKVIGQDPAQSSSIILTTVTDVVGFMSFLGLAQLCAKALGAS
jgi:magnesium transporter